MVPVRLHDTSRIAAFLARDPFLHLYELGDLDDFYLPYTTWYAAGRDGEIEHLGLLYSGSSVPTLILLSSGPVEPERAFLRSLLPVLPERFYAHLTPGLVEALEGERTIRPHGAHLRMGLTRPQAAASFVSDHQVVPLGPADRGMLEDLYGAAYPGNWFDPRMLETGMYFGVWTPDGSALASAAGVHVFSPEYRVTALGNVATLPEHRGRGLATAVCARLCRSVLESSGEIAPHVGLNVSAGNGAAIRCYERLGFEKIAVYEEFMLDPQGAGRA